MPTVDDVLEHFGVKGMKWGVHRRSGSAGQASSADAVTARAAADKARRGGIDKLSNSELQALINRMNLEQQFSRLQPPTASSRASKFVADILIDVGKQSAKKYIADFATQSIGTAIKAAKK